MMHEWFLWVVVAVNALFLIEAVLNIAFFRRATKTPRIQSGPFVSVIVPARNEERSMARCLESLLAQDYDDYEVIVVDDDSSDATPEIVAAIAEKDPRLRARLGRSPPRGVARQTARALRGGRGRPRRRPASSPTPTPCIRRESISWAVTNLEDHHVDVLSGYLEQQYGSLGETIVVPTMYAAMMLVPFFLLSRSKSPGLAFAIGQYVAIPPDRARGRRRLRSDLRPRSWTTWRWRGG